MTEFHSTDNAFDEDKFSTGPGCTEDQILKWLNEGLEDLGPHPTIPKAVDNFERSSSKTSLVELVARVAKRIAAVMI